MNLSVSVVNSASETGRPAQGYDMASEVSSHVILCVCAKRKRISLSAPVEKSSSSIGLMSSSPIGGDAVENSIAVSICGDFLGGDSSSRVGSGQNDSIAF